MWEFFFFLWSRETVALTTGECLSQAWLCCRKGTGNCVRNGADSQFTEPPLLQFCHITHFIFYPYTLHGSLLLILCLFSGSCFVISLLIDWHVCSSVGWSRAKLYVYARWTNLLVLGRPHPPSPWARPSQKPFLAFTTQSHLCLCVVIHVNLAGRLELHDTKRF